MHCSPELGKELRSMGERVELDAGMVVVRPGEVMNQFYFLESGAVHFYRINDEGRKQLLYTLSGTQLCVMSMICVLNDLKSFLQAEVAENGVVYIIRRDEGLAFLQGNEELKSLLLEATIDSWKSSLDTFDQISFFNLEGRLTEYLLHLTQVNDSKIINRTHAEIASQLNVSRESVSRMLKKMERENLVRLTRGAVEVLF